MPQAAPEAAAEVVKAAPGIEAATAKPADNADPLYAPQAGDRAPDTTSLKAKAVDSASVQKAGQVKLPFTSIKDA